MAKSFTVLRQQSDAIMNEVEESKNTGIRIGGNDKDIIDKLEEVYNGIPDFKKINHNDLTERDSNNAHPISSITGLKDELTKLSTNLDTHIKDKDVHFVSGEKEKLNKIVINGNGDKFLSNDGTYKAISSDGTIVANELGDSTTKAISQAIVTSYIKELQGKINLPPNDNQLYIQWNETWIPIGIFEEEIINAGSVTENIEDIIDAGSIEMIEDIDIIDSGDFNYSFGHNLLYGRDKYDTHPISAITELEENLDFSITEIDGGTF